MMSMAKGNSPWMTRLRPHNALGLGNNTHGTGDMMYKVLVDGMERNGAVEGRYLRMHRGK